MVIYLKVVAEASVDCAWDVTSNVVVADDFGNPLSLALEGVFQGQEHQVGWGTQYILVWSPYLHQIEG